MAFENYFEYNCACGRKKYALEDTHLCYVDYLNPTDT